jgi:glycosyltransferase involved in cell wall biosynthesis
LIDAVKKALPQCEGLQLVLTGSYRHSYQALLDYVRSQNLDDVIHFIGYVPNEDLVGFYSRSYALIYPSFFGPTNIPPLEAMELGCPVLVSDIYAVPEQCGDAALYFNPHSVEEIAQCIKRIWNDPKLHSSLIANALLRRRQHTLEGFAKGLGVAIDQALAS